MGQSGVKRSSCRRWSFFANQDSSLGSSVLVVMAVPGPVTASSSDGTNQLLVDGCVPARDATDVLIALGRDSVPRRSATESRRPPSPEAAAVLEHIAWQAAPMEQLLLATGLDLGVLALHIDALEAEGWVAQRAGWVERIGRSRS